MDHSAAACVRAIYSAVSGGIKIIQRVVHDIGIQILTKWAGHTAKQGILTQEYSHVWIVVSSPEILEGGDSRNIVGSLSVVAVGVLQAVVSENKIVELENKMLLLNELEKKQKSHRKKLNKLCTQIAELPLIALSEQQEIIKQLVERIYIDSGYKYRKNVLLVDTLRDKIILPST